MRPADDHFWMLDRQKVRAFVAEERTELDARIAKGEIFEHVQLDQRDVFIDMLSGLPAEQMQSATSLYVEEKQALYNELLRQAEARAHATESHSEKGAEEIGRTVGIVVAVALVLFVFFGGIALLRGG